MYNSCSELRSFIKVHLNEYQDVRHGRGQQLLMIVCNEIFNRKVIYRLTWIHTTSTRGLSTINSPLAETIMRFREICSSNSLMAKRNMLSPSPLEQMKYFKRRHMTSLCVADSQKERIIERGVNQTLCNCKYLHVERMATAAEHDDVKSGHHQRYNHI